MAKEQLAHFKKSGHVMAQAIVNLAIADVHLEMERPKEARKAAVAALDVFRSLEDNVYIPLALQSAANANLRLGDAKGLKESLKEAGEALTLFQVMGDNQE